MDLAVVLVYDTVLPVVAVGLVVLATVKAMLVAVVVPLMLEPIN